AGEGTPLLFGTGWVSHIEGEIDSPPVVHFLEGLAAGGRRRLVRFDWRGTGLSDRQVADVSTAARALDLEAVVDGLGVEQADVREYLPKIAVPALVIHRRDDPIAPFAAGRELAALLPGAQFVPLTGHVSTPFLGDSGAILKAVDAFLGEPERRAHETSAEPAAGLLTILFTDLAGSTALTQRLGDGAAQELH